ncbi:hypothetical protein KRR38_12370 [Novosphingobium sp. G106]|uniref:hypothetical protein n=1 Tax=Novosphingobium sp. G106 TaxID=2849500 RepID=UPI001C2CDF42|nr:hypothetical protein [Novosphingobium sp. G106]MBV1688447.1 hypothetical protein [Novosphingobium sp. G106]
MLTAMFLRFLSDTRGAMVAEYALVLALTFGCFACAALYLGDKATAAIRHVAETITDEVVSIAREAAQP